ncbi:dUTP pyrophosphatase [Angulomicrobium tetraedrale]|uniref:Deoxyuridine 5'-triphosphate nucleotidohydrolase n=1 Tax=Ancylobacter tetraedralis TaxID=217068 RepID=A0A839ZFE7_9HYPH|nr:dUTP diphosphatase [Ancylobacter tetraedralis]MBB3773499.1 dUTP pyrophosphatase [Ancylobacter tetraedralis]
MTETAAFVEVPVLVLEHAEGLPLPTYATAGAAGLDLLAALPEGEPLTLAPLARAAVPTGLCLALPEGYEGQVRPRSGLALKQGLTVLNAPGTVDADYRGEVKVLLINLGTEPVVLERGQRIAQLVVAPVTRIQLRQTGDLSETTRGSGGFGSTGLDARTISR